jgi:hypothetical protein
MKINTSHKYLKIPFNPVFKNNECLAMFSANVASSGRKITASFTDR